MYRFTAPITMGTATASLADCMRAIDGGETEFALDGLEHSDSAALSVLLAAARHARTRGASLQMRDMPDKLASLATLYGVEQLLAVKPATSAP